MIKARAGCSFAWLEPGIVFCLGKLEQGCSHSRGGRPTRAAEHGGNRYEKRQPIANRRLFQGGGDERDFNIKTIPVGQNSAALTGC